MHCARTSASEIVVQSPSATTVSEHSFNPRGKGGGAFSLVPLALGMYLAMNLPKPEPKRPDLLCGAF